MIIPIITSHKRRPLEEYDKISNIVKVYQREFKKTGYIEDFHIYEASQHERELLIDFLNSKIATKSDILIQYQTKDTDVITNMQLYYEQNIVTNIFDNLLFWKVVAPTFIPLGFLMFLYLFLFNYTEIAYNAKVMRRTSVIFQYLIANLLLLCIFLTLELTRKKEFLNLNFYTLVNGLLLIFTILFLVMSIYPINDSNIETLKIGVLTQIPKFLIIPTALLATYIPFILILLLRKRFPKFKSKRFGKVEMERINKQEQDISWIYLKANLEQKAQKITNHLLITHPSCILKALFTPMLSFSWFHQYYDFFYQGKVPVTYKDTSEIYYVKAFKISLLMLWNLLPSIINISYLLNHYCTSTKIMLNGIALSFIFVIMILLIEFTIKWLIIKNLNNIEPILNISCIVSYALKGDLLCLQLSNGEVFKCKQILNIQKIATESVLPPIFMSDDIKTTLEIKLTKGKILLIGAELEHDLSPKQDGVKWSRVVLPEKRIKN